MNALTTLLVSAALAFPFSANAQAAREGAREKTPEVLSAVDVAELMRNGRTDEDIAALLSGQLGFDRASALKSGQSDLQVITMLLTGAYPSKKSVDLNNSVIHKFEGDRNFKASRFRKAAAEYTQAIRTSTDNATLYQSRGDSYRKYLALQKPAPPAQDGTRGTAGDRARKVLCDSIYADYRNAIRINNDILQGLEARLIVLKSDMSRKEMTDLAKGDVAPYHYRAAGNIQGMREMNKLYRQQRSARKSEQDLRRDVADYKMICAKENAVLQEMLRAEKERTRDRKWVRYEKSESSGFYYDTSRLERTGDGFTVWTLSENSAGEQNDLIDHVRSDCRRMTIATMESTTYDEFGNLIRQERHATPPARKVMPGSVEEKLFREICR